MVDARNVSVGEIAGDGEYKSAEQMRTGRPSRVPMGLASPWLRFTKFARIGSRIGVAAFMNMQEALRWLGGPG